MSTTRAHDPPHGGSRRRPSVDGSVTIVRWPAGAAARQALAAAGAPRLLLVDAADPPPLVRDEQEDWIRVGADPIEVAARTDRLAAVAAAPHGPPRPVLDADGVLHAADGITVVPRAEVALLATLLDRPRHVVRREDLLRAAGPGGGGDGRALDERVRGLRRRIGHLGIRIHTLPGGYLLDLEEP